MWKIWLAFGLAGTAMLITVIIGFINGIRFTVILYRAMVSFFLLGGGTFLTAVACEKIFALNMQKNKVTPAQMTVSASEPKNMEEASFEETGEETKQTEFAPFTAESLNRVSPPGS